jgi:hypothetical protein
MRFGITIASPSRRRRTLARLRPPCGQLLDLALGALIAGVVVHLPSAAGLLGQPAIYQLAAVGRRAGLLPHVIADEAVGVVAPGKAPQLD